MCPIRLESIAVWILVEWTSLGVKKSGIHEVLFQLKRKMDRVESPYRLSDLADCRGWKLGRLQIQEAIGFPRSKIWNTNKGQRKECSLKIPWRNRCGVQSDDPLRDGRLLSNGSPFSILTIKTNLHVFCVIKGEKKLFFLLFSLSYFQDVLFLAILCSVNLQTILLQTPITGVAGLSPQPSFEIIKIILF